MIKDLFKESLYFVICCIAFLILLLGTVGLSLLYAIFGLGYILIISLTICIMPILTVVRTIKYLFRT